MLLRLLTVLGLAMSMASPAFAEYTGKAEYQEFVLQNAAVATGNGTVAGVDRFSSIALQVTIATTATVSFEASVDGVTMKAINCTNTATGAVSTTATATGMYQCNLSGFRSFQARISSWTSGAVTVYGRATTSVLGSGGGGGGVGGSTPTLAGCWATVADPTYLEGTLNALSCTLTGAVRMTLDTLLAGEDLVNNLLMVGGANIRGTVGNVGSGLLVAADCTSHCTPAQWVALPTSIGGVTFTSTIVSATSGDTIVKQTHTYYGANTNTATSDDAVQLCQIVFPAATQYLTKKFVQSCPPVTGKWLYYFVISSNTGSGAGVVTGDATATY